MKKVLKNVAIICISLVVAFLFHREITVELIANYIFITDNNIQTIIYTGILLIQFLCFYLIINQIINQKIDKVSYKILWFCYFVVLSFLLFGRTRGVQGFNSNPLDFIESFKSNKDSVIITIMNVLFFIPIGYLFRNKKYIISFISILIICLSIESIQYMFSLGIFDIDDIIFNTIGFYIGYLSCKNKNFNFINFKK
ncbi:VanZ family protein (plasmid) [Clostridium sp. FAM 1755]|uniref:VanZ family protein n=1 Tax=Clostridium caseinilyticum TaxID=3350403 RepID=UPI0038F5DE81